MDSLCAVGADCAGAYGEWRSEKSFATNESTVSICGKTAAVTESCIISFPILNSDHNFEFGL